MPQSSQAPWTTHCVSYPTLYSTRDGKQGHVRLYAQTFPSIPAAPIRGLHKDAPRTQLKHQVSAGLLCQGHIVSLRGDVRLRVRQEARDLVGCEAGLVTVAVTANTADGLDTRQVKDGMNVHSSTEGKGTWEA